MPHVTADFRILNSRGIHARPSAAIVGCVSKFSSEVIIAHNSLIVDAKSILDVMMLRAVVGQEIKITATGSDAEGCMSALLDMLSTRFFPTDFWDTIIDFIIHTATLDIGMVANAALSNDDLRNWYTRTAPALTAKELAEQAAQIVSGVHAIPNYVDPDEDMSRYRFLKSDPISLAAIERATLHGKITAIVRSGKQRLLQYGQSDIDLFRLRIENYLGGISK